MDLLGLILVVGAVLVLLLLGMLVLESAVKLHLAWRFRKVVENACQYPDCLQLRCHDDRENGG
jgi:hypothetical protein